MPDANERIAQVLSLENGKGIQYLLDEAYEILGNPCVLFNMEYERLHYVKNIVTDDRFWNEIVNTGVFSEASIQFFFEECFIDAVANSKTIALLTSDSLKYERLYGRIFNGFNDTVADLIMVACSKPLHKHDAAVFEAVCRKLSQEISADEAFSRYGILYHEKLIGKLLNGDIGEKVIYTGHLSNLYERLQTNLYVITAEFCEGSSDPKRLSTCRDLCKGLQPEHRYAVYEDSLVIVASSEEDTFCMERDLPKLCGYFQNERLRTGVSGCFDNLFSLRKHYREAVLAMKAAACRPLPGTNTESLSPQAE